MPSDRDSSTGRTGTLDDWLEMWRSSPRTWMDRAEVQRTTRYLTAWHDGVSPLLLCERHGDELAMGFPLKPGAREVSA